MPKERVIVFDGEDKFIAPRNAVYNVNTGEAQVVGNEAGGVVGVMLPDGEGNLVDSGAKKEFDDYMRRRGQTAIVPSPVEPDFCVRVRQFIQSNGDGLATGEQIMEAYTLFQQHCVEKPKETPIVPPVEPVKADDEVTPPSPAPPPPAKAPVEDTPKPISPAVTLPISSVSLTTPSLGARPSGGGGVGAASGGEKPKEEKKTNWLLWLLVAAGVVYLATRKKD